MRAIWIALATCVAWGAGPATVDADTATLPGRIASIDGDGDLYVQRPDGGERRRLASKAPLRAIQHRGGGREFFTWPNWAPDGRRLAVMHSTTEDDVPVDGLYVFDAETGRVLKSHAAPNLRPIYGYWSPDGKRLAYLLQSGMEFGLSLWPGAKSRSPAPFAAGAPFYFHWSPDATRILVHRGNDADSPAGHTVSLYELATPGERKIVTRRPAAYGPASFAPDGRQMAYAEVSEGGAAKLIVADSEGEQGRAVLDVTPRTAFTWAPDGKQLAVATTEARGGPVFERLTVVPAAGGEAKTIFEGALAAFFWSPQGDRILVAALEPAAGNWRWFVLRPDGSDRIALSRFLPSRPQRMAFQYFDQYALSHRFWSPDGKAFVFAGSATDRGTARPGVTEVYVSGIEEGAKALAIADGHTAFWSPR